MINLENHHKVILAALDIDDPLIDHKTHINIVRAAVADLFEYMEEYYGGEYA